MCVPLYVSVERLVYKRGTVAILVCIYFIYFRFLIIRSPRNLIHTLLLLLLFLLI